MPQSQSQSALPFEAAAQPREVALDALLRHALPAEAGVWDELRQAGGDVRAAWQRFAQWLPAPIGERHLAADLDLRVAHVAQQIRRDGVTHNVFSESGVASRPWSRELLPLLSEPAEWAQMLDETWRLQRDFYWAPNMVGVDWPVMRERYRALLPKVGTRTEKLVSQPPKK